VKTKTVVVEPPAKPKHAGGRPTLFGPNVRQRLMDSCGLGLVTEEQVAEYAGICYDTLRRWGIQFEKLQQRVADAEDFGEREIAKFTERERELYEFFVPYRMKRAEREALSLGTILQADVADWRAHAWWLSKRRPNEFARTMNLQHTGAHGGPIQITHASTPINDEDRRKRLEKFAARLKELGVTAPTAEKKRARS
jgi:hypothetical protein